MIASTTPRTDRTDRQVAAYNLRLARARLARATRLLPSEPMEFPGTVTADWSKYCKLRSRQMSDERVVSNLTALLASTPDRYSCRNIAFDSYGDLCVDGDWVADLDGNGEELCIDCARKSLLAGDLSADGTHICYSYIQDHTYAIYCDMCKELIRYGAYALDIVEVAPTSIAYEDAKADAVGEDFDPSGKWVNADPDEDPCDWDHNHDPLYEDGRQDETIGLARDRAIADGCRYQVRYYDCEGDSYNNSVVWDSAEDPEVLASAAK